ncbi:MAG: glutathione S-transferase N-terminal domain-containing protein [Azospirillaceae bacterium]
MKLYASPGSPFARKVRVTILELDLEDRIAVEMIQPRQRPPGYDEINPLGKVPALVLDDGTKLIDSPLICEYLNEVVGDGRLMPGDKGDRWAIRNLAALGDGIMDAAVLIRQEGMRPPALVSSDWIDAQCEKVIRGFKSLAETLPETENRMDLGTITVICCLDWVKLRFSDTNWWRPFPRLDAWREGFSGYRSLRETMPV